MKRILTLLLIVAGCPWAVSGEDSVPRPNIVVILCDDLGWGDLENYGHPMIRTPHLNRMAKDGIRFTDCYSAAPVCSPSRVGLLTGRNPNRAGVFDWIPEASPDQPPKRSRSFVEMRKEEFTIPGMLKEVGYATCMSGKWHCNAMFNSTKQAQPGDHGFDHWFATQNNASPSHENPKNFVRNGESVGVIEGFSCQIVADEFIDWLKKHRKEKPDQPFFGFIAYHEPHEPVASPPEMVERYEQDGAKNHDEAQYFANVENLDAATGSILAALDELGCGDDTLVIFTSDNGPETLNRYPRANRSYGSPGPLRGMKLHTHEAGYRVAGIMRWPDRIKAGQVSGTPVCALDFLPTFAALSGADLPDGLVLDGEDISSVLEGRSFTRSKPLVWLYFHSHTESGRYLPSVSMRNGDFKVRALLEGVPSTQQIDESNVEVYRNASLTGFEVFNVSEDRSEKLPLGDEGEFAGALERSFREIVESLHIWPAIEGAQ